ncbi:MAG: hypothetical protein ACK4SY_05705 [Pyrobaculum sp.]
MWWSLYAVLYLVGVLTLGLLLLGTGYQLAWTLDLVFIVIAVALFRIALKDVSAMLDIAADERERAEYRTIQMLLVATFIVTTAVLSYSLLRALFPFLA